jgi:hypothetical protein
MASKAKATKGTKCQRGDGGATETFTTIGEVMSFSGPTGEVSEINVTSFDSLGKEFISDGLPDSGEFSMEMNFIGNDAQQQGLRADQQNGVLRNFKLILNDHPTTPSTFAFAAIVKKFDGPKGGGVSEQYKTSVTLRISGLPTITYAP